MSIQICAAIGLKTDKVSQVVCCIYSVVQSNRVKVLRERVLC